METLKPTGTIVYCAHVDKTFSYSIAIFSNNKSILARGTFKCPSRFGSKEECFNHADNTMKMLGLDYFSEWEKNS